MRMPHGTNRPAAWTVKSRAKLCWIWSETVPMKLAESVLHGFLNLSADVEPVDRILAMMATTVAHPTTVPAT